MTRVIRVDKVVGAKEGDLRVWWIRAEGDNAPSPASYSLVASPEEAMEVLEQLIVADLGNDAVEMNMGGLEVYEAQEWVTWYNSDGQDIDDLAKGEA